MKRIAGFTQIELVSMIVIIGIMAAVAIPRLSTSEYRSLEFRDRTVSALRYAQKTASSHRRLVCVTFTATTVTLNIAAAHVATACDTPLPVPAGTAVVTSRDTVNAVFNPVPAMLYFQPDGRGTTDGAGTGIANLALTIAGATDIAVAGTTGHVE